MKPISLSRYLLRVCLVAALLPLLTMGALSYWQYQQDTRRVEAFTGAESLSSTRVIAGFLSFLVDETVALLNRMARETERGTVTEAVLQAEGDHQPQTDGLEVTDARGVIRLSSLHHRGFDVSKTPYFRAVRNGAKVTYSDVSFSPWLRQRVVMIAVPYQVHGQFGGIVMARLNLHTLHRLLASHLDTPRLRNTYVVDRHGHLISHHNFDLITAGLPYAPAAPLLAQAGSEGWLRVSSGHGSPSEIAGYMTMPGNGWMVVSTRAGSENLLLPGERLRFELVLASIAAALAGAAAFLLSRQLARPIEGLESAMRETRTSGFSEALIPTLSATTDIQRLKEIASLVGCYNAMAEELNRRVQAIRELQGELVGKNQALTAQNQELTHLNAQARAANKLKSEFLATMSHELRTPLNSIIGFTQLTLTDPALSLDEDTRINLEIVLKSAHHLLGLINGVLDLSKIEAGRATLFLERFEPNRPVEAAMRQVAQLASERGLALGWDERAALPPVTGDEGKVRQIVLNLLSNAIKFTRSGRIGVSLAARGGDHWEVAVRDTGVGIAETDQETIFEEFRQVDSSTTREAGGTGLGLAIARKLARLMGGELSVESRLGAGSTFTLSLPREQATHVVAGPESAAGRSLSTSAGPDDQRPIVLIIDEEPHSRWLLTEMLRNSPYLVLAVEDEREGLRLAGLLRPAALVLDVRVGREDTWRTLRELKAEPQTLGIPVVAVGFEENRALAFDLGAADYLLKPVASAALREALAATVAPTWPTGPSPSEVI